MEKAEIYRDIVEKVDFLMLSKNKDIFTACSAVGVTIKEYAEAKEYVRMNPQR